MTHLAAPVTTAEAVRRSLRNGDEIALLDLREEAAYAAGHPLFAINLPLGRIEERVGALLPRRDVAVVLYDDGDDSRIRRALPLLAALGYRRVSRLEGGLAGWRASGGEIFIDVNVPSKAFGELVEHVRHTPSIPATELRARLDRGDDVVILDARRFSEYATMSIPGGRSVPGGELALRVRDLAPDPATTVVVNCAGRTRSIIGAQSLVNAAIPNPVFALRNGTIGWTLARLELERGAERRAGDPSPANIALAAVRAHDLAMRAGVRIVDAAGLAQLQRDPARSLYLLDVRSPEEYARGHLQGFRSAPGGQLVQATDEWVGVRGGTLVLTDDDGVRARMTGHWLRQLGWAETYVLDDGSGLPRTEGPEPPVLAVPPPPVPQITPQELEDRPEALLIDLATSPEHRRGHIPGARFAIRADLATHGDVASAADIVLVSPDGIAAAFAAAELITLGHPARILAGGTDAWRASGRTLATGLDPSRALSAADDVYKRPYEGTDNATAAMQAYLDWEFGLVAQLEADGTHRFEVLGGEPAAASAPPGASTGPISHSRLPTQAVASLSG